MRKQVATVKFIAYGVTEDMMKKLEVLGAVTTLWDMKIEIVSIIEITKEDDSGEILESEVQYE